MKKAVIVLAVLIVAAVITLGVFASKNTDLNKQLDAVQTSLSASEDRVKTLT